MQHVQLCNAKEFWIRNSSFTIFTSFIYVVYEETAVYEDAILSEFKVLMRLASDIPVDCYAVIKYKLFDFEANRVILISRKKWSMCKC